MSRSTVLQHHDENVRKGTAVERRVWMQALLSRELADDEFSSRDKWADSACAGPRASQPRRSLSAFVVVLTFFLLGRMFDVNEADVATDNWTRWCALMHLRWGASWAT